LSDFAIFKRVAEYWGCGEMFREWAYPEAVFQILKRVSEGQPCDITGITDYRMLEECRGIQWPYPADDPPRRIERRLLEDGRYYHPDQRAKFIFEDPRPLPEPPTAKYPLILLTGRGTAAQWHTQTRTKKSAVLRKLYPESVYVEVNPADAATRGIRPNDRVVVESHRGRLIAKAFLTRSVQPGHIFVPMHYETTNQLTDAVFDPYSKQPSYKACAVNVRPVAQ
jgi:assimilatory nitrate reductase catalytic subunit